MLGPALAAVAASTCLATPVSADGTRVKAGPFVGRIARDHDVVDGRFVLHGAFRPGVTRGSLVALVRG